MGAIRFQGRRTTSLSSGGDIDVSIRTLRATRLLLNDMRGEGQFEDQSRAMAYYQEIENDGVRAQLGPPRE